MTKKKASGKQWVERMFVPVEPTHLSTALLLFEKMDSGDRRAYDGRVMTLVKHFREADNNPKNLEVGILVSAIEFRLQALASLRERPEMAAWSLPSSEIGCDYINSALLEAAASEPIVQIDDHIITFDPDSFFKRVLAISDFQGEA